MGVRLGLADAGGRPTNAFRASCYGANEKFINNPNNPFHALEERNRGRDRYRNRNRERERPMAFGHEKLGQRGYAIREELGEYGVGQFDTDTDTDTD